MTEDLLESWGAGEPSELAAAVEARRTAGLKVVDLVGANPYDHGFRFDERLAAEGLAAGIKKAARYGADARGTLEARESIARWHTIDWADAAGSRVPAVSPERIIVTPGTSLAYFYLFRLMAGGEVLCPLPTYPLFDDLAKIAGVRVRRYHLEKEVVAGGVVRWRVDPEELTFQMSPQTRAIVVVSPHNPTGTVMNAEEMSMICDVANRAGAVVILDEVFRTYLRHPQQACVVRPGEGGARVSFVLNGLSKSHYLPGWKAGWIVAEGSDDREMGRWLKALEYMSDSFLPVSDVIQSALSVLLGSDGENEVRRLAGLQRKQLEAKINEVVRAGWLVDEPQAGPYLCAGLGQTAEDEQAALRLISEDGVLLHPGSLYGMCGYLIGTIYNPEIWPNPKLQGSTLTTDRFAKNRG